MFDNRNTPSLVECQGVAYLLIGGGFGFRTKTKVAEPAFAIWVRLKVPVPECVGANALRQIPGDGFAVPLSPPLSPLIRHTVPKGSSGPERFRLS